MNIIPMTNLQKQYSRIKKEIDIVISNVLNNSNFILGEEVIKFEQNLADYFNIKYAISVASGTDALVLSLMALNIKQGDEIITTPFTFIATAEAIFRVGATPIFCDIDVDTYNIDINKIEEKITSKTKAIIPVHLYGLSCDMNPIMLLAKKYNLKIIEDVAQSFGSKYNNKFSGTFGDCGCLSFFPAKTLGCFGDGGAIISNSIDLIEKLKIFRNHGQTQKYIYTKHGINSRLDEIQAAVLNIKLNYIQTCINQRINNALLYIDCLKQNKNIILPTIPLNCLHSFNYFTIRVKKNRDNLQNILQTNGISSAIYYPISLHLQEVYKNLGYKLGDFPITEQLQQEVLSLPMCPELDTKEILYISNTINQNL